MVQKTVYLVRHGIAEMASEDHPDDEVRVLTDNGRKKAARAFRGLREIDCKPDLIVSSMLVRSIETADIIADVLKVNIPIERGAFLNPESSPADTLKFLRSTQALNILMVGHMPGISILASVMLTGADGVDIIFRKAAVCCITFPSKVEKGAGHLEWLLQPRQLRSMRG